MARPGTGGSARCAKEMVDALRRSYDSADTAEKYRVAGNLKQAIESLHKSTIDLGRADTLIECCDLAPPFAVTQMFARLAMLRGRIASDCVQNRKSDLSGYDPYEAYRKLRKPLPPQKGGVHGGKKGGKGYNRKRDKSRLRKDGD